MKLKKFPQSCALVETNDEKFLIDPGKVKFDEKFLEDWKKANFIFVTHRHGDHCYKDVLKNLSIPIYSTKEVAEFYPELDINIVKAGDKLSFGKTTIEVVEAVHGYILPSAEINEKCVMQTRA